LIRTRIGAALNHTVRAYSIWKKKKRVTDWDAKTLYSEFFTGERIHPFGLPRYCSRRESSSSRLGKALDWIIRGLDPRDQPLPALSTHMRLLRTGYLLICLYGAHP